MTRPAPSPSPLLNYNMLALRSWVVCGWVKEGGGLRLLRPRSQIRLGAKINASESVTKCAATIADSDGDGGI